MGVYALVMSLGFMAAFPAVGAAVQARGWRPAWAGVGLCLLFGIAPLSWLFVRSTPEDLGVEVDGGQGQREEQRPVEGVTLGTALRTPSFWVFAPAAAAYGLVASGIALFNESILAERGFDDSAIE